MGLFSYAVTATILASERACPRCGKKQVAPAGRRSGAVVCKHCGAEISAKARPLYEDA